jgi:cardiolipin synthase
VKLNHYTKHNKVKLVRGGKDYFQTLIHLIDTASESIYFQTYIFEEDQTGRTVADALMRASARGVKVFLLLDGYASQKLSQSFIEKITSAGVYFRWFEPLLRSKHFYIGRRLHHKVVVIDGVHCLVGGINICDRYNDANNQAWLDWAVHVEGDVAVSVFQVCARRALTRWNGSRTFKFPQLRHVHHVKTECHVRMIVNDWVLRKNEISNSYLEMFRKSRQEIVIMSSYFLPGRDLRKRLQAAARRNVKVKVVMTSVSDVPLAKSAERYLYHWLFRNNIEVYEYTKTILHGKITVCDKKWVNVGSYNLNELSAKASVEMNLEVADETFANHVDQTLHRIIQSDCIRITKDDFDNHQGWGDVVWQKMAYTLLRIILFMFTFYFKQERG